MAEKSKSTSIKSARPAASGTAKSTVGSKDRTTGGKKPAPASPKR